MTHKNIPSESRYYRLRRMTKEQVKETIRNNGSFHGFICGGSVRLEHIAQSWNFGEEIHMDDLEVFEAYMRDFETILFHYAPRLGPYASYYQIVRKRKPVPSAHTHYRKPPHYKVKELQR